LAPKFALLLISAFVLTSCGSKPAPAASQDAAAAKPVTILQFYPSSNQVPRGQQTLICYGVENAKSVRLEPPIEEIVPSMTRCIPYSPKASSEIKLIATGSDGSEVSKSFQIDVVAAAAGSNTKKSGGLIVSFISSAKSVAPGQEVTLCYQTQNATSVKIQPDSSGRTLPVKGCVTEHVSQKTQFTLVASGADGKQDQESVTVSTAP
jgi:hypothetical protein